MGEVAQGRLLRSGLVQTFRASRFGPLLPADLCRGSQLRCSLRKLDESQCFHCIAGSLVCWVRLSLSARSSSQGRALASCREAVRGVSVRRDAARWRRFQMVPISKPRNNDSCR